MERGEMKRSWGLHESRVAAGWAHAHGPMVPVRDGPWTTRDRTALDQTSLVRTFDEVCAQFVRLTCTAWKRARASSVPPTEATAE